jgi:DNA-binding transcriptional LysR family regulator
MAERIRTDIDWADVRVFVALARHGSLSAAARALSVNHATIARRIAAFERTLGRKLVERRPDGYVLTPAGTDALAAAKDMEMAAAGLCRGGTDQGPTRLVRVSATPGLAQSFLISRLATLTAAYRHLDIEVSTDMRSISLDRREADIALRLGRPEDGDLIARRLASLGYGLYGSAAWRRRIEAGAAPVFVGFDEANAHIPDALWLTRHFPRARIAFRANNQAAQAEAARADAGIVLLPHIIGRADDRLVPCPLDRMPPMRELWLVTRRQDASDPSIRTVTDFLVQLFLDERARFED